MANEVADALRTAAEKVAQHIQDTGTLQVSTGYVQVGAKIDGDLQLDATGPVASTVIKSIRRLRTGRASSRHCWERCRHERDSSTLFLTR
jgi:hypothetical protein